MKWHLTVTLAFLALRWQAAADSTNPVLTGVVNLPDMKLALLEVETPRLQELALGEGQRDGNIEVREILPEEGKVQITTAAGAAPIWLQLSSSTNPAARLSTVVLENTGLSPVLYLYARCTGRSLLRHPLLSRDAKFTVSGKTKTVSETSRLLEKALESKSIVTIPDENFIMVVPASEVSHVKPHAPGFVPTPRKPQEESTSPVAHEDEIIPAGMIDLRGADEFQVVALYTDLIGKRWDRTERLRPSRQPRISFVSVTPLTKGEARYAIETLLAWQGIKVVASTEDSVKAVRTIGE